VRRWEKEEEKGEQERSENRRIEKHCKWNEALAAAQSAAQHIEQCG
jgi:hypothetical protein